MIFCLCHFYSASNLLKKNANFENFHFHIILDLLIFTSKFNNIFITFLFFSVLENVAREGKSKKMLSFYDENH